MKHIKPFLESNNEYYQELDQAQFIRYRCDQFEGVKKLINDINFLGK